MTEHKAERAPWGDFPAVVRNGDLKDLSKEPEYEAAKHGDHKAMSYKRMKPAEDELHCEIKALLDRAKATDDQERNEPELDIPAEISRREKRLEAIQAAKARLEARQREADQARGRSEDDGRRPRHPDGSDKGGGSYKREFGVPDDRDQESFTDPDSRIMKHAGGGSEQSYNGYTAVDAEHQIIVAAELTNCAADSQALLGMLAAVQANTGEMPAQTLADAGFRSEAVLAKVADHHGDVIVASAARDVKMPRSMPRPIRIRRRLRRN